jgi:tetratricopeptide (TPR) repeat protein
LGSEEQLFRTQIEEQVERRDYNAALQLAVEEADVAYGAKRFHDGIERLNILIATLRARSIPAWSIYAAAYRKLVGLDHQVGDKAVTISDLVRLSQYYIRLGDFDTALAACNSALSLDHHSIHALNQKARVLAFRRDYTQAFKVIDESLAISAGNPRTLYLRGTLLANSGKYADALKVFEQVRGLEPALSGLARALADTRSQLNWKLKAVEGGSAGQHPAPLPPSQGADNVPAIQRKAGATGPEEQRQTYLEALYDEAVGDSGPPVSVQGESAEPVILPEVENPSSAPDVTVEPQKVEQLSVPTATAGVPQPPSEWHQAWNREQTNEPAVATSDAGPSPPVLAPEDLLSGAVSAPTVEPRSLAVHLQGMSPEHQLIVVLRDLRKGSVDAERLAQLLAGTAGSLIPVPLGILLFNFLKDPQDPCAMNDLLAWLAMNGYERLPLAVLEEAMDAGAQVDWTSRNTVDVLLKVPALDLPPTLRGHRADALLASGDTAGYVHEMLGAVRSASGPVSTEGIAHQLVQVLRQCSADEECVLSVLSTALELGAQDRLIESIMGDADLTRIAPLESAIVSYLLRATVDETTFQNNTALFERVTLGEEKSAILRRILMRAQDPVMRRRILQALLVLGTPDITEYTELVDLMASQHDTTGIAYLIQYLVDRRGQITEGRRLLERLETMAPMDYDNRYGLGLAAEQLDMPDRAAQYFIAALRCRPADKDTLQRAAQTAISSGEVDLLAETADVCRCAPSDIEDTIDAVVVSQSVNIRTPEYLRLMKSWGAYAGGRHEDAVAMSTSAIRSAGDPRFFVPLALSFERLGLPELAVRELDRGLRAEGVDVPLARVLKYHMARLQMEMGNHPTAAQLLHELGETAPGYRDVGSMLSRCGESGKAKS